MNPTIELMKARCSTRAFADTEVTVDEKQAILHTAMRAPTAGNMMLYSILEIDDQALKDELVVTCDDQPFIARAPWVLLFLADLQKWTDLFAVADVGSLEGVEHRSAPGLGDLMLACSDALIAAQNSVIAAESLGIGSCYIGDIMENGERVAELLRLPNHVFPVAMLCFGRPVKMRAVAPRLEEHVVQRDRYRRLSVEERGQVLDELARVFAPNGLPPGIENYAQAVYRCKFTSGFMREMNRSVGFWVERWQQEVS